MTSAEAVEERRYPRLRDAIVATGHGAVGAGIGVLCLYTLPFAAGVGALALVVVGRPLVAPLLHWVRMLADWERSRLRRLGHEIESPYVGPVERDRPLREYTADPAIRRDLGWLFLQGTWGLFIGVFVLQLPFNAIRDISFPLWWYTVPDGEQTALNGLVPVGSWTGAMLTAVAGIAGLVFWYLLAPKLVEWQIRPSRNLLGPDPDADLSERVVQLTATRAAALDAHAVELRRIERSLHDGAQNRIVGLAVLIGAARRELQRDPERADQIMGRAQDAVEEALAELRAVVRSILPPILEERGLAGALSALASECAVPCKVTVELPVRCPVSVEATAYFVVAESLTNVSKHSEARNALVEVRMRQSRLSIRVRDDGRGGVDEGAGSGIAGIRRRVAAHDGSVSVSSPNGGPTEIEVELPCGL
jgi:signal transduction histidine kinase